MKRINMLPKSFLRQGAGDRQVELDPDLILKANFFFVLTTRFITAKTRRN
jgi:hypothetical protein